MKISVYGKVLSEEHADGVLSLFEKMKSRKWNISVFEPFLQTLIKLNNDVSGYSTFSDFKEISGSNFVFSIGGDGTILEAVTFIRNSAIPIMGINTGRLGFLSSIGLDELDQALNNLENNTYILDERSLLQLDTNINLFGDINFALNEFTVHKKDTSSMVIVHAFLDGKFLNSYWADGLIISTATGSTAYSLSCGGPILLPNNENFVIVPVAPHNLNVRPFVISGDSKLTLQVEGRSDAYLVSMDSRSETIQSNVELHISRCSFKLNLVRMPNHSYLDTLRTKLNWGMDIRSPHI